MQAAHQRQAATNLKEIPTLNSVRRVLQTLAIALWRSNASHILQFHRRACHSARRVVPAECQCQTLPVGTGSGVVEELVAGPTQLKAPVTPGPPSSIVAWRQLAVSDNRSFVSQASLTLIIIARERENSLASWLDLGLST